MSDSEDDVPLGKRVLTTTTNGDSNRASDRAEVEPMLTEGANPVTSTAAPAGENKTMSKPAVARVIPKKPGASGVRPAQVDGRPSSASNGQALSKGQAVVKGQAISKLKTPAPAAKAKAAPAKPSSSVKKRSRQSASSSSSDSDSSSSSSSGSDSDSSDSDISDSKDNAPLSKHAKNTGSASKSKTSKSLADRAKSAKKASAGKKATDVKKKIAKKSAKRSVSGTKKDLRLWQTLSHMGVLFPPAYEPHGVKLKYEGKPVDLTHDEEEVASFFAAMKDTDYAAKPVFVKNFWNDFVRILTPANKKILQKFELCDFTLIYLHLLEQRELKKNMSKEEKLAIKANKEEEEKAFHYATIDGRKERVGNFRVEPPGLFRGRGEHPKMGKLKARIMPRDITINIGEKDKVPPCPIPNHNWGEVIHNHGVTWLAGWRDSINTKDWKYVQFAAQSSIKGESDLKKYEKARKLKDYVEKIREDYRKGWESKDPRTQQMSVAVYLIDKLALRAGGEKDDDLADTVGCCTLRVGHLSFEEPSSVKFDFLGKDSIRYEQTHEVDPSVFKSMRKMCKGKQGVDDLFDLIEPNLVNTHLQELMEGLTIKVFRTYNASITLDKLLAETKEGTPQQKKAQYDAANKEVAILCNHQKGVSKVHDVQMGKLHEKNDAMRTELGALKKEPKSDKTAKKIQALLERLTKAELNMSMKEELKTVSLGTSKINYLDPRITIAWCKKWEMPLNLVYTKALLEKFNWAMEVEPEFRF